MAVLNDKVCLVTGSSRGIGAAIALGLAAQGATVALHYNSRKDDAMAVAASLPGGSHQIFQADLSRPDCAAALVDAVMETFGKLDVLVNNAGIFHAHPPLTTSREDWLDRWQQIVAVNLVAPAVLSHAAANVMAAAGGGRIINIGSRGAFRGEPDGPGYGASKAGLHAMSQSLAVALAAQNIQVFAIAPGFVSTDMARELLDSDKGDAIRAQSPANRVARPDEVADAVVFFASTQAEFLTGSILDLNGASYLRS